MASSFQTFTATGSESGTFSFTLPFLDASHISVEKNGVVLSSGVTVTAPGSYPYTGASVVVSSPTPVSGDIIRIIRTTPIATNYLWKDFTDASILKADDLDDIQRYLTFLVQEADDTANLALDETFDGQLSARAADGSTRRIEDLSQPVKNSDAVPKDYVDSQSLYGQPTALTPQTWEKVGTDFTGTTGDCTLTLTGPEPVGANAHLYVVTLNGTMKTPGTEFTVDGSTFTLKMGSGTLAGTDKVVIRNFGIARNFVANPLVAETADTVVIKLKGTTSQTADLQQWLNDSDTVLTKVDKDGNITAPAVTTTGRITSGDDVVATGNIDVSGLAIFRGSGISATRSSDGVGTFAVGVDTGATTVGYSLDGSPGGLTVNGLTAALGGLDLTGTLQTRDASTDTLSAASVIRQIVVASDGVGIGPQNVNLSNTNDVNTNAARNLTGIELTITPKSTNSHLLFFGRLPVYLTTDSYNDAGVGAKLHLYKNDTATVPDSNTLTAVTDGVEFVNQQQQSWQRIVASIPSSVANRHFIINVFNLHYVISPDEHDTSTTKFQLAIERMTSTTDAYRVTAARNYGFSWCCVEVG